MSHNVTSIKVLTLEANMPAKELVRLHAELAGDLPSQNVLADHRRVAEMVLAEPIAATWCVHLRSFAWTGEGSGGRWWEEIFKEKVAPHIRGLVEAIVTWEKGDHVSGLRIRDGVVTEPKVIMTLEEEATR